MHESRPHPVDGLRYTGHTSTTRKHGGCGRWLILTEKLITELQKAVHDCRRHFIENPLHTNRTTAREKKIAHATCPRLRDETVKLSDV